MTFISYAQNFEDVMLWRALRDIDQGFYIDVGAYAPEEHSVTKAFYDRGWCGVNIEPIESLFRNLEKERPRDINLRLAVGSTDGLIKMYDVADTGLSTTEEDIAAQHKRVGHQVSEIMVESSTLSSIFRTHAKSDVHFLKIDVEGGAKSVIESLDFETYRPWIIVVEATLPMTQVPDFKGWDGLILKGGYSFVYFDGLNRFYLANERAHLSVHFSSPPNVFDEFETIRNHAAMLLAQRIQQEKAAEGESLRQAAAEQAELAREATEQAGRAIAESDALKQGFTEQVKRTREAEERAGRVVAERDVLKQAVAEQVGQVREAEERARQVVAERDELKRALAHETELKLETRVRADRVKVYGNALQRRVAEQLEQIREANARVLHAQSTEARLVQETDFNAAVSSRLQEREDLLAAVYASRSWRLTAPLRALSLLLAGRQMGKQPAQADEIRASPPRPTIFMECTHTYHSDLNTGIQRVVRNILRNAPAIASRYGYDVVPVIIEGNHYRCVDAERILADKQQEQRGDSATPPDAVTSPKRPLARYVRPLLRPFWRAGLRLVAAVLPFASVRQFVYAPPGQPGLARSIILSLKRLTGRGSSPPKPLVGARSLDDFVKCDGSILLLLDSSWTIPIWAPARRFKQRGGAIVGVIYDLIPITHSHTSMPELTTAFELWLAEHFQLSDGFVCISKSIADMLTDYIRVSSADGPLLSSARIGHFHLGSELDFVNSRHPVRQSIQDIFKPERHAFLMVGSIEPRKKHAYVLDAFDLLWKRGGAATLIIVGRHGWKTEDFLDRVANHPQLGRQLFILRDASDSELDHCYKNASSLVIASEIEGFGLPVVEAFQRGLPVMCSDIPVFREIADGKATFFDLSDPAHLTAALDLFCRTVDLAARRRRKPQSWISWRQSTEQLLAAVVDVRKRLPAGEKSGVNRWGAG